MFHTSLSPRSINIYADEEGIEHLKASGFSLVGDAVSAFVELQEEGAIVLYQNQPRGTNFKSYKFTPTGQEDLFRTNVSTPESHGLSMEQIGGAWSKQPVEIAQTMAGGAVRLVAPAARLSLDYVPTPKPRKAKKPAGSTILAELPDGSTLICEGVSFAELMRWQQDMTERGYKPEIAEGYRIVRD